MTDKTVYARLIEASASFKTPTKNKSNPHFKSQYADLNEVIECVRNPLLDAGLTFTQRIIRADVEPYPITLQTILTDGKDTVILAEFPVQGGTPQQIGSAITYAKRYSLVAAFGLAVDEDDDGNAASDRKPSKPTKLDALRKATTAYLKANPDTNGAEVKEFIESHIGCPINYMTDIHLQEAIDLLSEPVLLDKNIEF